MRSILIAITIITLCPWVFPETMSLVSSADTSISARDPDNNFGGDSHASSGRDDSLGGNVRRAIFQFDLSSIPDGSTINSATLRLSVVKTPRGGGVGSNFELHRMTVAWNEGNKTGNNGSSASTGESTWNSQAHGISAWSGGAGAAGGFSANTGASTAVIGNGNYVWSSAQLTADVQDQLDNPSLNYGWMLVSDNETDNATVRGFATAENAAPSTRPTLEVDYTPPAPPVDLVIESLSAVPGAFELAWSGPTNLLYDVQYRQSLTSAGSWLTAEAYFKPVNGSNVWTDVPLLAGPDYAGNSNVFYRVLGQEANSAALDIQLDLVADGLTAPVLVTHAGDQSGRLFVVEQTGRIRVIENGILLPTPFLDLSSTMISLNPNYDERGLLGLAFHPNYEANGRFFVHYSAPPVGTENNLTTIAEYHVSAANSNLADSASAQILLQEAQPEGNHAGGTLAFGPDGFLYLALGDGGGGGDMHGSIGNGQNRENLLGSILRIDIDSAFPYAIPADNPYASSTTFRKEIYAYGLRNPYQFSFDRGGSNALFCADVGQNLWEEINIIEKGGNYGWRITEGNYAFDLPLAETLGIDPKNLKYPIHNYKHGSLGTTVIGGFVYRGSAYPELVGKYVFGDFSTGFSSGDGKLYYLSETRPGLWQRFEFSIQPDGGAFGRYLKGFGEDEDGELYVLSDTTYAPSGTQGTMHRLVKP